MLKNAFGWTQYEGHGPGDELLGDPATALELGSSRGHAVAALATKGIDATGVDLSPVQIEGARQQWGHLPNAHFVHADMITFLTESRRRWEVFRATLHEDVVGLSVVDRVALRPMGGVGVSGFVCDATVSMRQPGA
ncbi:class I SAM-dependent methyltransferase [Nonomuraea composti]|uniref:class I SAM-dependent methyltransferase n=1 Tax=Nonomuraea composti TaxID=2720023 RepID=UPI003204B21D